MAAVKFNVDDKDYIDKLNQMSENAGDTAQLKADTEQIKNATDQLKVETAQIKAETQTVKEQTEQIKRDTSAIAAGDLMWEQIDATKWAQHGGMYQVIVAGIEIQTNHLEGNLTPGQWFTVANETDGVIFVKPRPGITFKGLTRDIAWGDRFGISPGSQFTFRSISPTELRIT